MNRDQRAKIHNKQLGFVFQNFNRLNRTSALENVELPLLYGSKMSARARRDQAMEMLSKVGLDDRHHHHPSRLFRELNEEQAITVILVTHDPSVARNAAELLFQQLAENQWIE